MNPLSGLGRPWTIDAPGKAFYVKPVSGNDGNTGLSPVKAVKTLTKALSLCTANKDDVVYFISEGNSATNASDRQSTTLIWNKDHVHLIGLNAGPRISHRARIAFASDYATAAPLFTLSANGCYIANIEFYAGVASANPTYAMYVTGTRNHIENCHIAGIGDNLMDATGNASLALYGGAAENYFENCVIGLDTIMRGTAVVTEIKFIYTGTTGVARTVFKGCYIIGACDTAGNYTFVTAGIGAIDRFCMFDNCIFASPGTHISSGVSMTYAMAMNSGNGLVILHNTSITGCDDVANDPANIVSNAAANAAATTNANLNISMVVIK